MFRPFPPRFSTIDHLTQLCIHMFLRHNTRLERTAELTHFTCLLGEIRNVLAMFTGQQIHGNLLLGRLIASTGDNRRTGLLQPRSLQHRLTSRRLRKNDIADVAQRLTGLGNAKWHAELLLHIRTEFRGSVDVHCIGHTLEFRSNGCGCPRHIPRNGSRTDEPNGTVTVTLIVISIRTVQCQVLHGHGSCGPRAQIRHEAILLKHAQRCTCDRVDDDENSASGGQTNV
mmetsp:Transcript_15674/g.24391  ORF Transcript_15674/g.24391 Transcript_15674/m.24391 type:complete len:228 (-) Transcript_15674:531-1214(-)